MDQVVKLERDGLVAVVTIDRPEARNAISRAAMRELGATLDEVVDGPERAVVITGAGDRAFVSGGDLKELAAVRTMEAAVEMAGTMRAVLDRVATFPVPVIAAVNGDAYGGGAEVAVACDLRIAADNVKCAFNQVALGIMPAWGGVERLTGLIGRSRALSLMATGRILTAAEAHAYGLFDEVVPRDDFDRSWRALAQQIAAAPRDALVAIKAIQQAAFPAAHPDLAGRATELFAATWVADTHWEMVERAEQRRRAAKEASR